jgi:NitT/TauT family transport system ATP-binding protein
MSIVKKLLAVLTSLYSHAMTNGVGVSFDNVSKRFRTPKGDWYQALSGLNFAIEPGQFVSLVGPTGCGKSTALTLLAGLEEPSIGSVYVDGEMVRDIDTRTGFVFQHDATFPWMNVKNNIAAGPKFRGMESKEYDPLSSKWIAKVGLVGFEKHFPHQLSGGMKKRVALAQTLINAPRLLLMDEPFSALDVQTRAIMTDELLALWETTGSTVVFVTHDLEEAIALSDRVIVLTAGPARVKADFTINLPRPRKARDIRFTEEFLKIYQDIWSELRDEVDIAYQRQLLATGV